MGKKPHRRLMPVCIYFTRWCSGTLNEAISLRNVFFAICLNLPLSVTTDVAQFSEEEDGTNSKIGEHN